MICGSTWREDVSRADVLKILSNILESMENRERKNNAAVNIREERKRTFLTYLKAGMEKTEEAKNRQEAAKDAKERRQKKKKVA